MAEEYIEFESGKVRKDVVEIITMTWYENFGKTKEIRENAKRKYEEIRNR